MEVVKIFEPLIDISDTELKQTLQMPRMKDYLMTNSVY